MSGSPWLNRLVDQVRLWGNKAGQGDTGGGRGSNLGDRYQELMLHLCTCFELLSTQLLGTHFPSS